MARDVAESVKGERFGVERRDVTDSARRKESFGGDVMLQRVQAGKVLVGRNMMIETVQRTKWSVRIDLML